MKRGEHTAVLTGISVCKSMSLPVPAYLNENTTLRESLRYKLVKNRAVFASIFYTLQMSYIFFFLSQITKYIYNFTLY
jgi:hypothetical protein